MSSGDTEEPELGLVNLDWICEGCQTLKQKLAQSQEDHTSNYTTLKQKIISTDLLIKKFKTKCDKYDSQAKKLEEMTKILENSQRDCQTLEQQMKVALEQLEPLKKANATLAKEKGRQAQEMLTLKDKLQAAEQLQKQYQELTLESEQQRQSTAQKIEANQKRLHDLESGSKRQENTISRLKDDISQKRSELSELKKRNKKLESELNKITNKAEKYFSILRENGLLPRGEKLVRGHDRVAAPAHCLAHENVVEGEENSLGLEEETAQSFVPEVHSEEEEDENITMETQDPERLDMSAIFSDILKTELLIPISPLPPSAFDSDQESVVGTVSDSDGIEDDELNKFAGLLETEIVHPPKDEETDFLLQPKDEETEILHPPNDEETKILLPPKDEETEILHQPKDEETEMLHQTIVEETAVLQLPKVEEHPVHENDKDKVSDIKNSEVDKSSLADVSKTDPKFSVTEGVKTSPGSKGSKLHRKAEKSSSPVGRVSPNHRRLSSPALMLPSLLEDEVLENASSSRQLPFQTDGESLSDSDTDDGNSAEDSQEAGRKVTRQGTTEFVVSKDPEVESMGGSSTDQDALYFEANSYSPSQDDDKQAHNEIEEKELKEENDSCSNDENNAEENENENNTAEVLKEIHNDSKASSVNTESQKHAQQNIKIASIPDLPREHQVSKVDLGSVIPSVNGLDEELDTEFRKTDIQSMCLEFGLRAPVKKRSRCFSEPSGVSVRSLRSHSKSDGSSPDEKAFNKKPDYPLRSFLRSTSVPQAGMGRGSRRPAAGNTLLRRSSRLSRGKVVSESNEDITDANRNLDSQKDTIKPNNPEVTSEEPILSKPLVSRRVTRSLARQSSEGRFESDTQETQATISGAVANTPPKVGTGQVKVSNESQQIESASEQEQQALKCNGSVNDLLKCEPMEPSWSVESKKESRVVTAEDGKSDVESDLRSCLQNPTSEDMKNNPDDNSDQTNVLFGEYGINSKEKDFESNSTACDDNSEKEKVCTDTQACDMAENTPSHMNKNVTRGPSLVLANLAKEGNGHLLDANGNISQSSENISQPVVKVCSEPNDSQTHSITVTNTETLAPDGAACNSHNTAVDIKQPVLTGATCNVENMKTVSPFADPNSLISDFAADGSAVGNEEKVLPTVPNESRQVDQVEQTNDCENIGKTHSQFTAPVVAESVNRSCPVPRGPSLPFTSTFVPIYIPSAQSSTAPSVIRQSTSSIAVVSPETSGPALGGSIASSLSRSATPSSHSSCSISASSPVSPLPPSPFEYMNIIPISPLPPSPVTAEPISPLPSSPSQELDLSEDTLVENTFELDQSDAIPTEHSPPALPVAATLQPTPLPQPITPLPITPAESAQPVSPLSMTPTPTLKDPSLRGTNVTPDGSCSSAAVASGSNHLKPSTSRHPSGEAGPSRRNIELSFSKPSSVLMSSGTQQETEVASKKALPSAASLNFSEEAGGMSTLRAKRRISHCKPETVKLDALPVGCARKGVPVTGHKNQKLLVNPCSSGIEQTHATDLLAAGDMSSSQGQSTLKKKKTSTRSKQGKTSSIVHSGGDNPDAAVVKKMPGSGKKRKSSSGAKPDQTQKVMVLSDNTAGSSLKHQALPVGLVKLINHELEGYLRLSGADPSPFIQRILQGKPPEVVVQVLIQEINKTGATCSINKLLDLLPPPGVSISTTDGPFITPQETQIVRFVQELISSVREQQQTDVTRVVMECIWKEVFSCDTGGINGDICVRLKANLCRLFTALCRLRGDVEQCRVFLYHVVRCHYLSFPNYSLAVSLVWPHVLHKSNGSSPVLAVIEFLVMRALSVGKSKHDVMRSAFERLCGWKEQPSYHPCPVYSHLDSQLESLIAGSPPLDSSLVMELFKSYELLLVTEPWSGAVGIIHKIFPFVGKIVSRQEVAIMQTLIPEMLHLIGAVLCSFPILYRQKGDVRQVKGQIIHYLLTVKVDNKVPMNLQEEAVVLLLRLAFYQPQDVVERLKIWYPKHRDRISPELLRDITAFMNTYPKICPNLRKLIMSPNT